MTKSQQLDIIDVKTDKFGTFKIAIWTAIFAIAAIFMAYRSLVIINNNQSFTVSNMLFKSIDELRATEENERMIYEQNAYKHYAKTYSASVARKIAKKETNKYFEARASTRKADLAADSKLVDGLAEETEKGGFLSRLTGDAASYAANKVYSAFEFGDKNSKAYGATYNKSFDEQEESDEDLVAMLKPKKKSLSGPQSSLPSGMGSGRKAILESELQYKKEKLDELINRFSQTNDPRVKKELNRTRGDIEALKKEMKM